MNKVSNSYHFSVVTCHLQPSCWARHTTHCKHTSTRPPSSSIKRNGVNFCQFYVDVQSILFSAFVLTGCQPFAPTTVRTEFVLAIYDYAASQCISMQTDTRQCKGTHEPWSSNALYIGQPTVIIDKCPCISIRLKNNLSVQSRWFLMSADIVSAAMFQTSVHAETTS